MSALTSYGEKLLGGKTADSRADSESYILFSIEKFIKLFGRKTWGKCCPKVSALSLSSVAKLLSDFSNGKVVIL